MQTFNIYITGEQPEISVRELDRIIKRYEWFTTARRARRLAAGDEDAKLTLPLMFWPTIPPDVRRNAPAASENPAGTACPEDGIIERFLQHGGYRIVPDEGSDTDDIAAAAGADAGDDELLTEELAEIYRSQGLGREAKEIYRKLSLLNPEKSIYFADVIAEIDAETKNNQINS